MQDNSKAYKDKSHKKKIRTTKMNQYITKTNISNSNNLNIVGKDKVYIQKKRNRSISNKKAYFKGEKRSALHKIQSSHDSVISGINWKKIKALIPTKTTSEVKYFAKDFFNKMKSFKDDNLGIDFTSNSINNLKDMLYQIQSEYPSIFGVISILKELSNKNVKIRKFKKIHKKKKKNDEKKELNKLEEEKHNYINNNLFSNLNTQNLNDNGKNEINNQNNNNINNNLSNNNKIIVFNVNVFGNNFINYNNNNCIDLLLNNLKCNIENLLLFEYISDLNSNSLNEYMPLNNTNYNIYINYLYRTNNLLSSITQNLNSISFIFNIIIYNLLNQFKSLIDNNWYLINNNDNLQNNIDHLINYINQINQVKYNNNN